MSGLDLGRPDDPQTGAELRARLAQGAYPRNSSRRLLQFEGDQGGDTGGGLLNMAVGPAAALGTGIADAGLSLLRGAQWLGVEAGVLPEDTQRIPGSLQELLPDDYAMRLESRLARAPRPLGVSTRAVGETVGSLTAMVPTGGLGAAATLPGRVIAAGSVPGQLVGQALGKIPAVAQFTRTAAALPQIVGASTGFGLHGYIAAEGDQEARLANAAHGMAAGAALGVLGKAAQAVEAKILDRGLSEAQANALSKLNLELGLGKIPTWDALKEMAAITGKGQLAAGKGVATLIEGTGFASLDERFWESILAGLGGDEKARATALEIFLGSLPAALMARTGNPNDFLMFRREMPNLNTLDLRLAAESTRQAKAPPVGPGPQQPKGKEAPTDAEWRFQDRDVALRQEPGGQQPIMQPMASGPLLTNSDPLLRSGWEMSTAPRTDMRVVDVEFPGFGSVKLHEDGAVEVPAEVYRIVRGGEPQGQVKLEGEAAAEFARDLAAVSAMRRMKGDLIFGGSEAWAGGPWKGNDGRLYTIGLDGQVYSQGWPAKEGEGWKAEGGRTPQLLDNDSAQTPEMQRWFELAKALHRVGSTNPGLDLLDASLVLASKGSQESRNVKELQDFLLLPWTPGVTNADAIAPLLTPQNVETVGHVLGQLGSGHLTAMMARQALSTALLGPPPPAAMNPEPLPAGDEVALGGQDDRAKKLAQFIEDSERRQAAWTAEADRLEAGLSKKQIEAARKRLREEFPVDEQGNPRERTPAEQALFDRRRSTEAMGDEARGIAGSRDWNSRPKEERKAAAEAFVAKAIANGAEVVPSLLKQTFGVTSGVARGILERVGAKEAKKPKITVDAPDRSGEAGFLGLPTKQELADVAKRVDQSALAPRKFYEKMTRAVARSGPAGKEIQSRTLRVIDETKQNLAKLGRISEQMLKESTGIGVSPGKKSRANRAATKWAESVDWNGPYGESRWKQVLEGRAQQAPPQVVDWADVYKDVRMETGAMAQAAGTMQSVGGQFQPFVPVPRNVPLYLRQMDPEFARLLGRGGPEATEAAALIAAYGRNQIAPDALLREWTAAATQLEKREASELSRTLPDLPTHIRLSSGRIVPVIEWRPHQSVKRMIEGSAARAPFIKHVGQDDVPGSAKPGTKGLLNKLQVEGGDTRQAEYLLQSLQNATPDRMFGPLRRASTLLHTGLMMPSALLDPVEPLATLPQFVGYRAAVRGLVDAIGDWTQVKKWLEDMGAITIEAGHHLMVEGDAWIGYVTQKLALPKQLAADFGAVWAGAAARVVLRGLQQGKFGDNWRARFEDAAIAMEFTPAEIAELLSGNARPELEKTYVRRVVANGTGQLLRGERSKAGASQWFNALFPLNKYFMNRFEQMLTSTVGLRDAVLNTKLSRAERVAKAQRALVGFWPGALMAGSIGLLISLSLVDGLIDAARALVTELMADPLSFAARAAGSSWLGGAPRAAVDLATTKALPWSERLLRALPQMPKVVTETGLAAVGDGPYRNEDAVERFGTFIARTLPILRRADFVAGWLGFPIDSDMEGAFAQLNDWKRNSQIPVTMRGGEAEDQETYRAMAKLARHIRAKALEVDATKLKNDPDIQRQVRETLGVASGADIGESLRGKKILTKFSPEQLADLVAKKGDGVIGRLQAHDAALDAIADTYVKVPRDLTAANLDLATNFDQLLITAKGAAVAGQATGFRKAVELIEETWDARKLAGMEPPRDELRRLSALMADHPEVAREMFKGEEQLRRLDRADPKWRPMLIERFLEQRLRRDRPMTAEAAESRAK